MTTFQYQIPFLLRIINQLIYGFALGMMALFFFGNFQTREDWLCVARKFVIGGIVAFALYDFIFLGSTVVFEPVI